MSFPKTIVLFASGFLVATVTTARAQLAHFSFSDPDNVAVFTANSALISWNGTAGPVEQLDIFFDPTTAVSNGFGSYTFSDPVHDVWHIRVHTVALGDFNVTHSIDTLQVSDNGFDVSSSTPPPDFESFDFSVTFDGPISTGGSLPNPLSLPALGVPGEFGGGNSIELEAGQALFPVKDLAEVVAFGSFRSARGEIVDSLTPVPEPSTYGLAALSLIAFAGLARSRRNRVQPQ